MKTMPFLLLACGLLASLLLLPGSSAAAQEMCPYFENGYLVLCQGGEDNPTPQPTEEGGGDTCPPGEICIPSTCVPGEEVAYAQSVPFPIDGSSGMCYLTDVAYDACTGEVLWTFNYQFGHFVPCPTAPGGDEDGSSSEFPCSSWTWTNSSFTCNSKWEVCASLPMPGMELHLRPFAATLVRWPSAARFVAGGSSGTDFLEYYSTCGGGPATPKDGDMRNIRLTLTGTAAGPMEFFMPRIGTLLLPPQGPTDHPATFFQWELPSYPGYGETVLAASVPGINKLPAIPNAMEIPGDTPVFVGWARAPFSVTWRLTYEEYHYRTEAWCDPVLLSGEVFNCVNTSTGADGVAQIYYGRQRERDVSQWVSGSRSGRITPSQLAGLSATYQQGENFLSYNVLIRRMNDADRIDDPVWRAEWHWGGRVYWAVREGQAQIGWPGTP